MKNFIKVTKGGEAHVILAANRRFYESQGWAIEEVTYEEALVSFPDYADVIAREKAEAEAEAEADDAEEAEAEAEADDAEDAEEAEAEEPAEKPKRSYNRRSSK